MVEVHVDRWLSGNARETFPVKAEQESIAAALASLDGRLSTEMSFNADGNLLLIGGQDDKYFVQYLLPDDQGAWVLVGSPDASGETELTIGRQLAAYASRQIADGGQAVQAAMSFVRSGGGRDDQLVWDRDF